MATTLSLTTITERTLITIDRKRYELRHPDALPIGVLKRFELMAPRISELAQKDDLTDEESDELSRSMAYLVDKALDAPSDVKARLTDVHRLQVMELFTTLRVPTMDRGANPPSSSRKTAKRSRA